MQWVAAIVLFVCVAVYLNWSYDQGSSVNGVNSISNTTAEKNLGEAALVNSDSALELEDSSAEPNSSAPATETKGKEVPHRRMRRKLPGQPTFSPRTTTLPQPG